MTALTILFPGESWAVQFDLGDHVDDASHFVAVRFTPGQIVGPAVRRQVPGPVERDLGFADDREQFRAEFEHGRPGACLTDPAHVGVSRAQPAGAETPVDELDDRSQFAVVRNGAGVAAVDGAAVPAIRLFEDTVAELAKPKLDRPG